MTTAMGAAMRRIHLGNALSAFGNGFTVPFLFVYVAQVRGMGAGTAGVVLSTFAVSALLVLPFTGRWIDLRGPIPVVVAGSVVAGLGSFGLGSAGSPVSAVASAGVLGVGIAVIQPALATLVVWCSAPAGRSRAFAAQFFLQNLALGVGGLLGGMIVDPARPATFTRLFAVEGSMFLGLAAIVATVRLPRTPGIPDRPADAASGGWRAMASHRAMAQLCVLGAVLFFACYGQFESGLAAFATQVVRIRPATLGAALAANTAAIVAAQYLVLRPVERRRRSRVIAGVGVVWAVAWAAAGLAGVIRADRAAATTAIISTYALFGLGEAMLSPTLAPLVADLAPDGLVGRYNSAFALVKQVALAIGPAAGGALAAAGLYAPYILLMTVCAVAVTLLASRLRHHLTPAQEGHPLPPLRPSACAAQGRGELREQPTTA